MYLQNTNTTKLFSKWQRIDGRLQQMHAAGKLKSFNSKDVIHLIKKWNYYLKKINRENSFITKSVSVFSIALTITLNAQSQCDYFTENENNNPIIRRTSINVSKYYPNFIDIDNDGDLDCYTIYYELSELRFRLSRNIGNKEYPYFKEDTTSAGTGFKTAELDEIDILGHGRAQPQFVDIDGDSDYDCFLVAYHRDFGTFLVYFENKGTSEQPSFIRSVTSPINISDDYFFTYAIADTDGDGDYDCITSDIYYQKTYLSNTGTKTNPHFTYAPDPFPLIFIDRPSFYDWNQDGLLDYIDDGYYYENKGTVGNPYFVLETDNAPNTNMYNIYNWVDLNNDGFPEIFNTSSIMNSTAPDALIKRSRYRTSTNDIIITLKAYPQGEQYIYEWRRNGKILENATNDSVLVTKPGTYIVSIKGNCGTGISKAFVLKEVQQLNSFTVSDNVSAPSPIFKIYPNPFTDKCYIKLPDAGTKEFLVKITDLRGVVVYANKVLGSQISVGEHFKSGVYFIEVISDKNTVYRQKIIKQ